MFLSFLQQAIRLSAVFIFGSTGETLVEKGGQLNLGIPGIMCFGAVGGCMGAIMYTKALNGATPNGFLVIFIPILMAFLFAGLMGLLYSFFTISLRCNQNVTGLTITTFGAGIFSFWGGQLGQDKDFLYAPSKYFLQLFPNAAQDLGWFGKLFLSYGPLVYLAFILAIIVAVFLRKTRVGMNVRAVGENPAAADSAGLNVTKYKYLSSTIGAAITGLGGLFYIMDQMSGSIEYTIDAMGWLAVALVIFSMWKSDIGILGAILFAALYISPNAFPSTVPKDLLKMIPYVVTVIILIVLSIVNKKENQPPQGLGVPYFREER